MTTSGFGKIVTPGIIAAKRVIGRRSFDFSRQVAIIANIDSAPDGIGNQGTSFNPAKALEACESAVRAGADWIEIRGVAPGPGLEVPEDEELRRLLSVLRACRQRTDAVISVETSRGDVARHALLAGADVINDATGLRDQDLARVVAEAGAGLIITPGLAEPPAPVPRSGNADAPGDVATFLREAAELAVTLGVRQDQIFVDPGQDLQKNNYQSPQSAVLLGKITSIGYPLLVPAPGPFISEAPGQPREDSMAGAIATMVVCILLGARLIRVHDAAPAIAAVRTTEAVLGWRQPLAPRHNLV